VAGSGLRRPILGARNRLPLMFRTFGRQRQDASVIGGHNETARFPCSFSRRGGDIACRVLACRVLGPAYDGNSARGCALACGQCGRGRRLPERHEKGVESRLEVIVAVTELGAKELRRATSSIPIVVVLSPDPVAAGLVDSLARPGGNVTGLSLMAVDLSGKRVALLKEAVPSLSGVTLMMDPKELSFKRVVSSSMEAAKTLGLDLRISEVTSPSTVEKALDQLAAEGGDPSW
jgi:ABC transporter substrate binding protein